MIRREVLPPCRAAGSGDTRSTARLFAVAGLILVVVDTIGRLLGIVP